MEASQEYYISLIERLRNMPDETEWLEYKVNNDSPELIGEYISGEENNRAERSPTLGSTSTENEQ